MAYRKSRPGGLLKGNTTQLPKGASSHIIPDVLYPAVEGMINTNTHTEITTITDSSASAHTITNYGGRHNGANPKIGSTSVKLDTADYLLFPDHADWDFGTGAFCIEFWYKPVTQGSNQNLLHTVTTTASANQFNLIYYPGSNIIIFNSGIAGLQTGNISLNVGHWYHVAIARDGSNSLQQYINGVASGSAYTSSWDMTGSYDMWMAKGAINGGSDSAGYFDEIRIVKGEQVYSGAFTPPTALTTTGGTYASGTNVNTSITASNTKLLIHSDNGGHVGAYGTEQSDGRKYYYTDIKGSKPIKDPRIGAHFGSQRHPFKSIQNLEQEEGYTDGQKVFSVDGREWIRARGDNWTMANYTGGMRLIPSSSSGVDATFVEVTGYFIDIVLSIVDTYPDSDQYTISLNGGTPQANDLAVTVIDPKTGRYVTGGNSFEPDFYSSGPTLGINTVKIYSPSGFFCSLGAIELIAQDRTSTATRSQIQIPSQNVVSYGKKFTVAGTPHYNPFATKGDDSASTIPNNTTGDSVATGWAGSTSAYWDSSLDTATSLGLSAWESGGNYYRPVNGGRIVKWVDSTGTIKTSVNMMPPEAHSIREVSGHTNPTSTITGTMDATGTHNWSTQYLPQFGNKPTGSNLTTNGTFEADDNWSVQGSHVTSEVRASDQAHSGTYSWKIVTSGTNSGIVQDTDSMFSVTAGKLYRFRCWVRCDQSTKAIEMGYLTTGCTGRFAVTQFMLHWTTLNTWQEMDITLRATTSGTIRPRFMAQSSNITWWLDDFTVYEIEEPEEQSEIAKTFHYREFGNGAANGGPGAADPKADLSMLELSGADKVGHVMDDGLTSLVATNAFTNTQTMGVNGSSDSESYLTFIGTGLGYHAPNASGSYDSLNDDIIVQNLPYGTHIIRNGRNSGSALNNVDVDGIEVYDDNSKIQGLEHIDIFQPKMPPIPKDAVVIADYMLMADFVASTGDQFTISKGTRFVSNSRDYLYDENTNESIATMGLYPSAALGGYFLYNGGANISSGTQTIKLPYFGTSISTRHYNNNDGTVTINGSAPASTADTGSNYTGRQTHTYATLGLNTYQSALTSGYWHFNSGEFSTPIHTSSHYQAFETPFLYELVGGDRNIEQTNLVVTGDGKTWDEVTRDTSYIGNVVLRASLGAQQTSAAAVIFDDWRGIKAQSNTHKHVICMNKDFAIAYDRQICLKSGSYAIRAWSITSSTGATGTVGSIYVNGTVHTHGYNGSGATSYPQSYMTAQVHLERGDYVQMYGQYRGEDEGGYWIERI